MENQTETIPEAVVPETAAPEAIVPEAVQAETIEERELLVYPRGEELIRLLRERKQCENETFELKRECARKRKELEEELRLKMASYLPAERNIAMDREAEATKAFESLLEAQRRERALNDTSLPEVGAGMCKWEHPKNRWGAPQGKARSITKCGVVLIWEKTSEFRSGRYRNSMCSVDLPRVGEKYIRLVRKDGKPGMDFERFDSREARHNWFPLGVTPADS